jgi:large subunit ribosomal protein L18
MGSLDQKHEARLKRKKRIRKKLSGTPQRPRLCVFRSKKHIYAQVVDDTCGKTLAAASTMDKAITGTSEFSKKGKAAWVGKTVGQRALEKGIKQVVFDRNGFLYHGRVKAVSDGAREAGLDF